MFWIIVFELAFASATLGQIALPIDTPVVHIPFRPTYKFTEAILKQLSQDTFVSKAAWELSYIGEYKMALTVWDKEERKWPQLTEAQRKSFESCKPVNAQAYIAERAKSEQIIILNEAHHQPNHRVFTTSLLKSLYDCGFRYFGAEGIWHFDTLLNKRKYPVLETGGYMQEPCYSQLLREAEALGYHVFHYESTRAQTDSAGINLREVDQARNIKKILDKDPHAKILIHCGFDHLIETPYRGWGKCMAGRLIEYTGINPFTIDQTRFTEHSASDFENPYFRLVDLDYYAIFLDSLGRPFNGFPRHNDYDARVYHPRSHYINGRPHWAFEGGKKTYFPSIGRHVTFPCLVYAYLVNELLDIKNESEKGVPFDVIQLQDKSDKKALALKPGTYVIIVQNKKGEKNCSTVTIN